MPITSKKFAVTGGAGFIGSRLVRQLLHAGHHVLVIDNFSVGLPVPPPGENLVFVQRDICNAAGVLADFESFRPEIVFHLAAIHHIPTCEKNAPEALRVNVVGTQAVLDASERIGVQRIVLASSGAVYDWVDGPLNENSTRVRSTDIYSLSKHMNEQQLELTVARGSAAGVIARIFNTIGPNDPNAHIIPDINRQLKAGLGETIIALGNTFTRRDYVFVEDVAAGLIAAGMTELSRGRHVFNIGTGEEHTVEELVHTIAALYGIRCTIKVDPARMRKVDRLSQVADAERANSILGWRPKHSFAESVRLAHRP